MQLVEALRYRAGRLRVQFPMASMQFFIDTTFWPHYDPVVDSASNRKKLPEILPGGKSRQCIGSPSQAKCLEMWEPQPPGTLSACPGLYRGCFTFYKYEHKEAKGVDAYVNKQHAKKGTQGKPCNRWRWSTSLQLLQLLINS